MELHDNLETNNPYSEQWRFSAPIMERIGFLFGNGMTNDEIFMTVSQEFSDTLAYPITKESVRTIITKNKPFFLERRKQMGEMHLAAIQGHALSLFEATHVREHKMVEVFNRKMDELLISLASLDLDEKDDKGNFTNTNRAFVIIEMIDKLQTKCAQITGANAMREVAIYKLKLEAQAANKDGGFGLPNMRDANPGAGPTFSS